MLCDKSVKWTIWIIIVMLSWKVDKGEINQSNLAYLYVVLVCLYDLDKKDKNLLLPFRWLPIKKSMGSDKTIGKFKNYLTESAILDKTLNR